MGRFDEGIALYKKAIEIDPLSSMLNITLGWAYRQSRQYDNGIAQLRKMFEIFPSQSGSVNYHLAWNYVAKGMYQEALALATSKKVDEPITCAYIYAASGKRDEAIKVLDELLDASRSEYVEPVFIAGIYTGLGDKDQAFHWLNTAYEERSGYVIYLKTEPFFDPLRSDPRFVELCKKMGLE